MPSLDISVSDKELENLYGDMKKESLVKLLMQKFRESEANQPKEQGSVDVEDIKDWIKNNATYHTGMVDAQDLLSLLQQFNKPTVREEILKEADDRFAKLCKNPPKEN